VSRKKNIAARNYCFFHYIKKKFFLSENISVSELSSLGDLRPAFLGHQLPSKTGFHLDSLLIRTPNLAGNLRGRLRGGLPASESTYTVFVPNFGYNGKFKVER